MKPSSLDVTATEPATAGRPFCYRCHKPEITCICGLVPQVQNRTPVWILQHPRERFHPIGTERIARLGLARVHVHVRHHHLEGPPRGFPSGAALLYPKRGARPLEDVGEMAPPALVVLDGTWAHARTLFRDNPWLHQLPRYGIEPPEPSRYRIRKEPALQCVSTIESLVYALSVIEPDTPGLQGLIRAFDGMIDEQIQIYRRRRTGKRRSMKPRRQLLGTAPENLVLVEGEAITIPGDPDRRRSLVYWCAVRPSTGATFERVVHSEVPPSAEHLFHMGLTPALLDQRQEPEIVAAAWTDFVHEDDVLVGWTRSTLDIRPPDRPTGHGCGVRVLKSAYCNKRRGSRGTLEQMFEKEGLTLPELGLNGRAGRRLAAVLAMYRVLSEP